MEGHRDSKASLAYRGAVVRRLSYRMAAGSVMAALVVGLTAVPAFALTWTVMPGGNFSGAASTGSTVLTDTGTTTSVTCTNSKIIGHLDGGFHATGYHIGKITNAVFTNCSDTANSVSFTVTPIAASFPWFVNANSYASPIASGRVTGIQLDLAGSNGCSVTVGGTIHFHYSNSVYALKFTAPAVTLSVASVGTGCPGAPATPFTLNDAATYVATYFPITPHQKIIHP